MSLANRVRESFSIKDPEVSPTELLTQVHKSKLSENNSENSLNLVQTKSRNSEQATVKGKKLNITKFANYN